MLLVRYYGSGEWTDIVMIDHENPANSDITRKGMMCPQDHILALDYDDACMLINAKTVTTRVLIPVDISKTTSRGKLVFLLPELHTFKTTDIINKCPENITIHELLKMYGFIDSSTVININRNNKLVLTPKIKEHEKRNNDYIAYLKETIPHIDDKPEPHTFNFGRKFLQAELIKSYGQTWLYNFEEWNKQRPYKDIVKLKRGR